LIVGCNRGGALADGNHDQHAGEGVVLGEGLRYAYGESCVRALVAAAGHVLDRLESASSRTESGVQVPGLVVVAAKAGLGGLLPLLAGGRLRGEVTRIPACRLSLMSLVSRPSTKRSRRLTS